MYKINVLIENICDVQSLPVMMPMQQLNINIRIMKKSFLPIVQSSNHWNRIKPSRN